jgi:uncharacterized membrane protein YdjX (TVP38/TMEM64 family)
VTPPEFERREARKLLTPRFIVFVLMSASGALAVFAFQDPLMSWLERLTSSSESRIGFAVIVCLWFLGSQLVPAPAGTISIIFAATILGVSAGVFYFLAMCATAPIVHQCTLQHPLWASRLLTRAIRRPRAAALARLLIVRIRRRPVQIVMALRLLPILPSAGCALLTGLAGLSWRSLLVGTLATGWIRPVLVAFSVELVQQSLISTAGATSPALNAALVALVIAAFCGSSILGWMSLRTERAHSRSSHALGARN